MNKDRNKDIQGPEASGPEFAINLPGVQAYRGQKLVNAILIASLAAACGGPMTTPKPTNPDGTATNTSTPALTVEPPATPTVKPTEVPPGYIIGIQTPASLLPTAKVEIGQPTGLVGAPTIDQELLGHGGPIPKGVQDVKNTFEEIIKNMGGEGKGSIDSCWNGASSESGSENYLRLHPYFRNGSRQYLWSASGGSFNEYPLTLSLDANGYHFDPNQELKPVPGSENAVCVYGGKAVYTDKNGNTTISDLYGEKPVLVRNAVTLADGRQAFSEYFKSASWVQNPNVLKAMPPTAIPIPESHVHTFEKYGIFFPDRLSSESETSFLKGIYLSQSVMEKTGVESLHISPEKMDNIGKYYLGLLAWMQRNNVPEYQFGYPAPAGGMITSENFWKLIEKSDIKTPVDMQLPQFGPHNTFRASKMEIYVMKLSEYTSILNYYNNTNEKITNLQEFNSGVTSDNTEMRFLSILDEDGTFKCIYASNLFTTKYGSQFFQSFEAYQNPRTPNETFMDFNDLILDILARMLIKKFDMRDGPIPLITSDGLSERLLGCDKYYYSKPVDCSQAAEEIFSFTK